MAPASTASRATAADALPDRMATVPGPFSSVMRASPSSPFMPGIV